MMEEMNEEALKSRKIRIYRLILGAFLTFLLINYILISSFFIIPAIPISMISEYHKQILAFKNAALV
jgi:hypothetical protein